MLFQATAQGKGTEVMGQHLGVQLWQHIWSAVIMQGKTHTTSRVLTVENEIAILLQITQQFFIGRDLVADAQFEEVELRLDLRQPLELRAVAALLQRAAPPVSTKTHRAQQSRPAGASQEFTWGRGRGDVVCVVPSPVHSEMSCANKEICQAIE